MQIDFNNFSWISSKLSNIEINNLNQIFSNPEVQKILSEIEENRLKRQNFFWKILFSWILFFSLFLAWFVYLGNFDYIFVVIAGFILTPIFAYFFAKIQFNDKVEKNFKKNIIPHLCKAVYSGMKYSINDEFFLKNEDLDFIIKNNFYKKYDWIVKKEDSFYFELEKDWRKIFFNGWEVETKKITKTKTKKWTKTKTEYKKHFLGKIFFQNSRLNLQKPVIIKSSLEDKILSYVTDFFMNNRVKLENIEFEKIFNVYSEDQIGSRMLITPAFMDRLLEFSKKSNRNYEFFFFEDYFYLQREIIDNFLEPKIRKNIFESLGIYVDFYVEIREIIMLAYDMNLLYYSKISVNSGK